MRHVRPVASVRRCLISAALGCVTGLTAPAAPVLAESYQGEPGRAEGSVHASTREVHDALVEALAEWKLRKHDPDEGVVKTSWIVRERGRERFRDRVVAEFATEGFVTVIRIRHERQRKMTEMRSTLSSPPAAWRPWDGDPELAHDVLRSVQRALGEEPESVDLTQIAGRPPAPRGDILIEQRCALSAEAVDRVLALKADRRELVKEVKAIDAKILDAVYADRLDELGSELERLKGRKAALQAHIAEVDREILALVLAD